jgi:hypothetical protein
VSVPSIVTVCRTAVVLGWLLVLSVAAEPGWTTLSLALALVAVWLAPLVVRHARRPVIPLEPAAAVEPAEAPAA